jgi:hypothetical protein
MPTGTAASFDAKPQQHGIAGIQLSIEGDGPRTVVMIHSWPDTAALWALPRVFCPAISD